MVGDSIADGVGQDPTWTVDDGLHFGGLALPAGARIWHNGVEIFAYQDSAGAGPDPGYLPHLVNAALAAGYTAVHISRFSTPGITTSTTKTDRWPAFLLWAAANDFVPDLVIPVAGSNDSQVGENAAFEAACGIFATEMEGFQNARILWVEPVAPAAGSYPEADLVRADIQTIMVGRTRGRVSGTEAGYNAPDGVHPDLATYRDQGAAIFAAFLAAS